MNKCKYTITNIVIIRCYMNTIGDMRNEKDFFYRCNEFENIHDFEKVKMYYWNTKFYMRKITINFHCLE